MTEFNLPTNTLSAEIPPMPFGYTLSRVYRILRDHLKVFLGLGAPPGVALVLLYGVMFWVMFDNLRPLLSPGASPAAAMAAQFAMMRIMFPAMMVAMVPMTAIFAFYLAAAFYAANKIDSGIGTGVRESFGVGWTRLGRSLGLLLWIYFRAFGPLFAIEAVLFGLSVWLIQDGTLQKPPVAAFAIVPLIWLLCMAASLYGTVVALRMSLAFPASLEEGLTAGEAIRRSAYLTLGSKGRIFLLLLVVDLIGSAFLMVFYIVGLMVFGIGTIAISALQIHSASPWVIVVGGTGGLLVLFFFYVSIALIYGSLVIALSVVYHDQRRRKDALLSVQRPATGEQLPPGAEPA
jgi:hypothetical protein